MYMYVHIRTHALTNGSDDQCQHDAQQYEASVPVVHAAVKQGDSQEQENDHLTQVADQCKRYVHTVHASLRSKQI